MIVAFVLTSTAYAYETWLRLVNDGVNIRPVDRINFPRLVHIEQWLSTEPRATIYTWGNYYVNDTMMRFGDHLEEAGAKLVPYPTEKTADTVIT